MKFRELLTSYFKNFEQQKLHAYLLRRLTVVVVLLYFLPCGP